MSQEQPHRPSPGEQDAPIKYGDVFDVTGKLADQPIAPRDAAMMQSAENVVLGQNPKGGAAATMQSAATRNENAGVVGHEDVSPALRDEGVTVTGRDVDTCRRVVTESVAGQVVEHFPTSASMGTPAGLPVVTEAFTIGDALEATAVTACDKPVTQSDASAIQAAKTRATGRRAVAAGGVAAVAMSAATANAWAADGDDVTTLGEVLADAKARLAADKVVTAQDAERVVGAELCNNPSLTTYPGGVADTVAAAARLNRQQS